MLLILAVAYVSACGGEKAAAPSPEGGTGPIMFDSPDAEAGASLTGGACPAGQFRCRDYCVPLKTPYCDE